MERTDLQIFSNRTFKLSGRIIQKLLTQTTRQALTSNIPIDITNAEISGNIVLDFEDSSQNIPIAGTLLSATNGTYELNVTNQNRDAIFAFNSVKIGYEYFVVLALSDGTAITLLNGTIYLRRI